MKWLMAAHTDAAPSKKFRARHPLSIFLLLAGGAVSVAACANRIVVGPGFELYLAPFFYLLAYWLCGVRVGVAAAIALMVPTYFWWGHPVSIFLAAGHVLFVHWFMRRSGSYGIATLTFGLTAAAAVGFCFITLNYETSPTIAALLIIRKFLNDVLLAALVDAIRLLVRVDRERLTIHRRTTLKLGSAVGTTTLLFAVTGCTALFVIEVLQFNGRFHGTLRNVNLAVHILALQDENSTKTLRGERTIQTLRGPVRVLLAPTREELGDDSALAKRLGCSRIDDGRNVTGPNDRSTFAYWVSACKVESVTTRDHQIVYAASIRPLAVDAYQRVLNELLAFGALAGLGLLSSQWLNRLTQRTIRSWFAVIEGFGSPELKAPGPVPLKDFQPAIDIFIAANNAYVALSRERERLSHAVVELKKAIDLTLATEISFDPGTGQLRIVALESCGRNAQTLIVHEGDRQEIANLIGQAEARVEFRLADSPTGEWFMLIARAPNDLGRWQVGCVLRLRQAKIEQDRMLHQARLMDLGGMASALSHEIKQPLFTIALAAENALFQVEESTDPDNAAIAKKLIRIGEQVERARSIIDQVSNYARVESPQGELFDPIEAVTASAAFLRPLLVADDMRLTINSHIDGGAYVAMSRVGLEQVMVNALQNAHDSIMTRRQLGDTAVGRIEIDIRKAVGEVQITIADDGAGLAGEAPQKAFEAFFTTKGPSKGTGLGLYVSRQIMLEAGGNLTLTQRPEWGAVLKIEIPCHGVLANQGVQAA